MLAWQDYVSQILESESSIDGITMSFGDSTQSLRVPPIIKASVLMLDKMLEHQGNFNVLVFPERLQSIFVFTLVKLLYNISEGRIDRKYDPDNFTKGENLCFGKAVAEFLGVETRNGKKCIMLKFADLDKASAPMDFYPVFQKTTAKKLSKYKVFKEEKKKATELLSVMDLDKKYLQLLSDYKTHMDSSIVNMTSIINAKEMISECRICGQNIKDAILVGQVDYEGTVHNIGAGQLGGIPAIVLAADLYAIVEMINKGHPIQSIIIDSSNANALVSQMDALDTIMRIGVPVTCVTDVVNSFDLQLFQERGFNIWRWDETSITDQLYDNVPLNLERKIKHCAIRKVEHLEGDGREISTALKLLYSHRKEMETASAQMIKVYDKLFSLAFDALWETVPFEEGRINQAQETFEDCNYVLMKESIFLSEKMYEDFSSIISCLKKVYSKAFVLLKHEMLANFLSVQSNFRIAIIVPERCDKNRVQAYWQNWIQKNSLSISIQILHPAEYYLISCDRFDGTIVVGWLKRAIMRKILFSFNTPMYIILLYDYERRWRSYAISKWNNSLDSSQNRRIIERSFTTKTLEVSTSRFVQPELSTEVVPQHDEFTEIELVLRENKYRQYTMSESSKVFSETIEAVPVNYVGGYIAFYRTGHKVISASNIIENDAEKIEMKLPTELKLGDFIVVRETDHDLVKEIADVLLERTGKGGLRELSAKWKEALTIETLFNTPEEIYERLQAVGCTRGYQAVRSWIFDEDMIAPHSKEDLEHIAAITGSGVLKEKLEQIYAAAHDVKSAHVQAGRALSLQLKNRVVSALKEYGDIDPFNIWDPIEMQIDGVGMVRILKIIDIGAPVVVQLVDTNRLFNE